MITKRGLGRGLGALLASEPSESESLVDVAIDQIEVNPNQPRKVFDFTALDELAASIKASGVIQPIIVRKIGGSLSADRRRAAVGGRPSGGLDRIPALVRDATDAQSLELALVENLLREDLNPIEAAQAYQKLLADFDWTQESWRSGSVRTARRSRTVCVS
jgi:ParB family chromosome partitioning protein